MAERAALIELIVRMSIEEAARKRMDGTWFTDDGRETFIACQRAAAEKGWPVELAPLTDDEWGEVFDQVQARKAS